MTERTEPVFETWQESLQAFDEAARRAPQVLEGDAWGDVIDRENAGICREILQRSGIEGEFETLAYTPGYLRDQGFDEDSAVWIAAHWLRAFHRMVEARRKIADGDTDPAIISELVMHSQEMGRNQERMWWRVGVDQQTGKRREALAVGKRAQEASIHKASAARRIQAVDAQPEWHELAWYEAQKIRETKPWYTRWRIAGEISKQFGKSQPRCDVVLREKGLK